MSSITAKALLLFEQSQNFERQEHDPLEDVQSLTIRSSDAITNTASSVPTPASFELIQRLDTSLYAHVANKDYDDAMQVALLMQKCMPKSYHGYQRAAQIHLIRNEFIMAQQVYCQGLNTVQGSGHKLLRKSAEDAVDIFDEGAIKLAKNGKLGKAHDMASWIIWLFPKSSTGYLRTGEILEMQGKYPVAEEVYYRGVSKVVSVAPKNLDSLVQHLVNVKRQIKRNPRYDFIMRLPLEVASDILQYFGTYDLLTYMDVSRSWKERILLCSTAWRVTTINTRRDKLDINTIQHIKSFVQKFVFVDIPKESYDMEGLLKSIADKEFENLMDIEWRTGRVVDFLHAPVIARIFECLDLTSLSIEMEYVEEGIIIPLEQVLERLPNLKQLSYYLWEERWLPVDDDFIQNQGPTKITDLTLGCKCEHNDQSVANDYFVPLIPLFPNLVYLYITYCAPGNLPTITQSLPQLRQLVIDADEGSSLGYKVPPVQDSTVNGLRSIQVTGVFYPKEIIDTIINYSSTLEYVTISLRKNYEWHGSDMAIDTDWDWKSIPKINAPVLNTLYIRANYIWPVDDLVGDCPVLRFFELECDDDEFDYGMW